MSDDGWLSIEVHHALNLVQLAQFDTVYHEHFQYYTLFSAVCALATSGLAVVDVELLPTHGGSLRIWARSAEIAGRPTNRVDKLLKAEEAAGLHRVDGYSRLQARTEAARHELLRFLLQCRAEGKRVVGYGAPGKGNTLLNYGVTRTDLLEYTVDRNPYKQGQFTPGARDYPIYAPERIAEDRPDVGGRAAVEPRGRDHRRLAYINDWGGELVCPFPTLHKATDRTSRRVTTP